MANTENVSRDGWSDNIRRHHQFLLDHIDPDFGLLERLLTDRILSFAQKNDIKAETTVEKRNGKLLEIVLSMNKSHGLIDALRSSNQTHVVNYLEADGKYSSGDDWPLGEREKEILIFNFEQLTELIDFAVLGNHLLVQKAINTRQAEFISVKQTSFEQNEAFLEVLRRRSIRDYKKTIRCLNETNQPHVARLLEDGGGIVRVHINTDGDVETEREIADKITDMLGNRSIEECGRILEMAQIIVIAAKTGHSVILYIHLQTIEQLNRLQMSMQSGSIKDFVQLLFKRIASHSKQLSVTSVTIKAEELGRVKQLLLDTGESSNDWMAKLAPSTSDNTNIGKMTKRHTTINEVPFEIVDVILQKSYLFCIKQVVQSSKTPAEDDKIIILLTSVNFWWFKRLTNRKVKASALRKFSEMFNTKYRLVIRNNYQYLQSCPKPRDLIKHLKSADFITDAQAASVCHRKHTLGKENTRAINPEFFRELLTLAKALDETRYSVFSDCLRRTERRIAKPAVYGGVVIKIGSKPREAEEKVSSNLNLVEIINQLLDNIKPQSTSVKQLLNRLREAEVEILEASLDRDVNCWIWCRTPKGIKNIQHLRNSNTLMRLFAELTGLGASEDLRLNLNSEDLKKTIVSFLIGVSFISKLAIREHEVKGMTKLGRKIYVLCGPRIIYVFDDAAPFKDQGEIEIEHFGKPWDIVSSERQNCLYITDNAKYCVWKIEKVKHEYQKREHKITSFIETGTDFGPWSLSITIEDQLVMISRDRPHSMRIYGCTGELIHSIALPGYMVGPRHAVKTWNGNFIISYELKEEIENENNSERLWVLSEVGEDGKTIVRQFMHQSEEEKLDDPRYLAIDSAGRVFVADRFNDRVVLLDSDLRWNGTLIPAKEDRNKEDGEKNLWKPWRLFYDEENRQLIVGGLREANVYTLNKVELNS